MGPGRKSLNLSQARVRDYMTRAVVTIASSDSCAQALMLMESSRVKHLPVLEGQRLVGILTERDIRRRLPRVRAIGPTDGRKLLSLVKVGGVMTYSPRTVDASMNLSEAAAIMVERRIGSLPVVQAGRLVGILTARDAIGLLARPALGGRKAQYDSSAADVVLEGKARPLART